MDNKNPRAISPNIPPVAQIFNLLYRRFPIGWALPQPHARGLVGRPQNAILRYSRLKICVTVLFAYSIKVLERWAKTNRAQAVPKPTHTVYPIPTIRARQIMNPVPRC